MTASGADVVTALIARLAATRTIGEDERRSMPPEFYTSEAFLALEREHVFRRQWACIGHVGEIPLAGDFFTTELIGEPLLVTRDRDGGVRVFSNVCRHRGNVVEARSAGTATRFTCGYHAWTYALDGRLLAAPFMERNSTFKKADCGLPSFRSSLWNGFIFVDLDGAAEPLVPRLSKLDSMIVNYRMAERSLVYRTEDVWHTNWKNLAENFIEGYHLTTTHAKTLHPITPTELCEKIEGDDAFTGYKAHYNPATPERGPFPAGLTREEQRCSPLFCVFPNLVFSVAPHFTLYVCLRPQTADDVALRWGVAGVEANPEAPVVQSYVELCHAFNAEDRAKLETLQTGLKSRYFTDGPLAPAPFEGTIWDIYRYMARQLAPIAD
jgi:choline monooxygenase